MYYVHSEHDLCTHVMTRPHLLHVLYIVVDYGVHTHCVFQKCFFHLVLVFDFEYSKLTELPMTMVRLNLPVAYNTVLC